MLITQTNKSKRLQCCSMEQRIKLNIRCNIVLSRLIRPGLNLPKFSLLLFLPSVYRLIGQMKMIIKMEVLAELRILKVFSVIAFQTPLPRAHCES